jgi:hypothetical protein
LPLLLLVFLALSSLGSSGEVEVTEVSPPIVGPVVVVEEEEEGRESGTGVETSFLRRTSPVKSRASFVAASTRSWRCAGDSFRREFRMPGSAPPPTVGSVLGL